MEAEKNIDEKIIKKMEEFSYKEYRFNGNYHNFYSDRLADFSIEFGFPLIQELNLPNEKEPLNKLSSFFMEKSMENEGLTIETDNKGHYSEKGSCILWYFPEKEKTIRLLEKSYGFKNLDKEEYRRILPYFIIFKKFELGKFVENKKSEKRVSNFLEGCLEYKYFSDYSKESNDKNYEKDGIFYFVESQKFTRSILAPNEKHYLGFLKKILEGIPKEFPIRINEESFDEKNKIIFPNIYSYLKKYSSEE
jgi:hypothetical protein